MPITKGAIRKLRADKKKTAMNLRVKKLYRSALKKARQKPGDKTLAEAFRRLDRAAKSQVIHKNKADRLKSRLAKLLPKPKTAKPAAKLAAKTKKK